MDHRLTFFEKLKAYKLTNNVYVLVLLTISVIVSLALYILPIFPQDSFLPQLALAMATSLLASIFCLVSDVYVQFKNSEKDQLLEGMHEFGIKNLHFNKQELLTELVASCEKEMYLSGYRLILMNKLSPLLAAASERGVRVRLLVSPPWMEGFRLVYGENEQVIDNYCRVFHALAGRDGDDRCQVRFVRKPLFSDTFKLDEHLVTGPYLHNKDGFDERLTASAFFTYDLVRRSRLYELMEDEARTLWAEAEQQLNWTRFEAAYRDIRTHDYRESEKVARLREACDPVPDGQ